MGDETPPPLDAEFDELDNYWLEDTTITVPRITKQHLDEHRDGKKWGPYLEELRRQYADPLTLRDVDEIAERLKNEVSMANEQGVKVDIESIFQKIEKLESAVTEATDNVQQVQKQIEQMEARR